MTSAGTTSTRGGSTARPVALTVLVAAVAASIVNAVVSLIAQGLGADASVFMGLMPALYVPATVVGVLLGTIGWAVIRRRSARPAALLRVLVPIVLVITLFSDVAVGLGSGWGGAVALGLMHVSAAGFLVLAARRFLPVTDRHTTGRS